MAEDWFNIVKIKGAMKRAAEEPIPFAFGVGAKKEDGQLAMHLKRGPEFLGKALKKEGFKPARILLGTATTEGPVLIVTCEEAVPKSKKAIQHFLKENKLLQKKVKLIGPDGEFDVDDDEDREDIDQPGGNSSALEEDVAAEPKPDNIDDPYFKAWSANARKILPELKNALAADDRFTEKLRALWLSAKSAADSGDYQLALQHLKKVIKFLAALRKQKSAQPESPDDATNSKQDAQVQEAIKKLTPMVKEFAANNPRQIRELKKLLAAANSGSGPEAMTAIRELAEFLKGESKDEARSGLSLVKLGKARVEWISMRRKGLAQVQALKAALLEPLEATPENVSMVEAAFGRVISAVNQLDESLADQIDLVLNEEDPAKRSTLVKDVSRTVQEFNTYCTNDPVLSSIDENPFMPKADIIAPMAAKLTQIEAALGAGH